MKTKAIILSSGIWLTLPILLWNAIFINRLPAQYLPEIFNKDIPPLVAYGEAILRVFVFGMPLLFTIGISSQRQKRGLIWYLVGAMIYFLSWVPLLFFPESLWSKGFLGFFAPGYTPLFWLIGIGLLGEKFYFPVRYKPVYYIAPAFLFLIFHIAHVAIVYWRVF